MKLRTIKWRETKVLFYKSIHFFFFPILFFFFPQNLDPIVYFREPNRSACVFSAHFPHQHIHILSRKTYALVENASVFFFSGARNRIGSNWEVRGVNLRKTREGLLKNKTSIFSASSSSPRSPPLISLFFNSSPEPFRLASGEFMNPFHELREFVTHFELNSHHHHPRPILNPFCRQEPKIWVAFCSQSELLFAFWLTFPSLVGKVRSVVNLREF